MKYVVNFQNQEVIMGLKYNKYNNINVKMKYNILVALFALVNAHKINQRTLNRDEVDDLLLKQDQKDAKEVADKEFNDANSKMNQIGTVSKQHTTAEDDDYMKSVFDSYAK